MRVSFRPEQPYFRGVPSVDRLLDVTQLEPGTVLLGKYRMVKTIGIGGMGVVIAADHLTLQTRVAVKFLLPKLLSNEALTQRFVREARTALRINSEHIARVMDVDTVPDGPPFMVMEYLEGKDLGELVHRRHRFSVEEAIDYVAQAAEALAQAHHLGIVHRDIKPANLFLVERADQPSLVKVLDFGISKTMDDGDTGNPLALTKTTTVLGSGLYMSPEQMRSAKSVDHRTDIYALGICLYELLAHTQPYTAESFAELAVRVSTEPPDPLRRHRPDVPEELASAIARAYSRAPEDRYQSVAELMAALAPFAAPTTLPLIQAVAKAGSAMQRTSPSLPPGPGLPRSVPPPPATTAPGSSKVAVAPTAQITADPRAPSQSSAERPVTTAAGPSDGPAAVPAAAEPLAGAPALVPTLTTSAAGAVSSRPQERSARRSSAPWIALAAVAAVGAASWLLWPRPATREHSPIPAAPEIASAPLTEPTASERASLSPSAAEPASPPDTGAVASSLAPAPSATAASGAAHHHEPRKAPKEPQQPCFKKDPASGLRVMVPCP